MKNPAGASLPGRPEDYRERKLSDMFLFAGASVNALHLLRAADAGHDKAEMDDTLLAWANLGTIRNLQAPWLFVQLRDAVDRFKDYTDRPDEMPEWTTAEVDAEVKSPLFALVYGRRVCGTCLDRFVAVDEMRAEVACTWHRTAIAA